MAGFPDLGVVGRFDGLPLQLEAVSAGQGLGFLPCFVADRRAGEGPDGLVRLGPPERMMDVWILSHRDLRATARVNVFRRFFIDRQGEISDRLAGTTDTQPMK